MQRQSTRVETRQPVRQLVQTEPCGSIRTKRQRAKSVDACRDSATGAAAGADGALRMDTERHQETFRTVVYSALEGERGRLASQATEMSAPCFFSPRRLPRRPPCAVPTRPARCVSGFWTRQVGRSAGRRDPTRPWFVRVLHSTSMESSVIRKTPIMGFP